MSIFKANNKKHSRVIQTVTTSQTPLPDGGMATSTTTDVEYK